MKVLLVTDQYVDVRPDGCYCNYALLGTLRNMSSIGQLYVVAAKPSPNKPAAQPINQKIEFISADRVFHLEPVTLSIKSYLTNRKYNRKLLEDVIPKMDLVIGYTPGHNLDYAFDVAKKSSVPYMTFLVACPWDGMHNHQRWIVRMLAPVYYLRTRRLVKKSHYVHYVTKLFLQKRYPTQGKSLGCSDTNLGPADALALSRRLEKLSLRTESQDIKLITVAHTDVKYKGQEYVIRAIARLVQSGDRRYHYYMIGAGEGLYLKELSRQLKVEDNVHFLGRQAPQDVMRLLSDSDVYLQPSLQEGLPRAVVEAMSVALPCIGFDTGGIPELLEPEFVVKKRDVNGIVERLRQLEDIESYKQRAIHNFNVAQEYEYSKLTSKILDFFAQIRTEITVNQ